MAFRLYSQGPMLRSLMRTNTMLHQRTPAFRVNQNMIRLSASSSAPAAAQTQATSSSTSTTSISSSPASQPSSDPNSNPKTPVVLANPPDWTLKSVSSPVAFDTLRLARTLQYHGVAPEQTEIICVTFQKILQESLERLEKTYITKYDIEKTALERKAELMMFKGELTSTQEARLVVVQRDAHNLETRMDKLKTEMNFELERVKAGYRLDLNLANSNWKEQVMKQKEMMDQNSQQLNEEIFKLKSVLDAYKYDIVKYCIGTIVSVAALGVGVLRLVL